MLRFLRAIYSQWGSGVTGTLSAPLFILAFITGGTPRIIAAVFAVLCLYVAAYLVWAKEESERRRLEDQICGFPLIRIAPDGFHADRFALRSFQIGIPGAPMVIASEDFDCLRLRLVNRPTTAGTESVARGVRATIVFMKRDGTRLVEFDGRWADTPQESERDRTRDFVTEVLAVSFPIGQARNLDLVAKQSNDDECYGVNNDNFTAGAAFKLPNRRMPKGILLAQVRVQGVSVDCSIDLRFDNEGKGGSLRVISSHWKNNLASP
jgi:hypothetical protein